MENQLIRYCAPTLAGLKTGSVFNMDILHAEEEAERINRKFNNKDMYVTLLAKRRSTVLMYVYRRKKLAYDLSRPECISVMKDLGYQGNCMKCIEHLKERISAPGEFPHEIGLFLSYPVEDVIGFIENKGKNALLCGFHKVYANAETAQRQFFLYQKCTRLYSMLFREGKPFDRLVVRG